MKKNAKWGTFSASRQPSRMTKFLPIALVAAVLFVTATAGSLRSQPIAPVDPRSLEAISQLAVQLKEQQQQMAANQDKIEAQTAQLKEEIRLLRIYTAREGSALRR